MVSSINSADSDDIQQMMAVMYQRIGAADKDGISGLSKNELSTIDAGDDVGGSAFLKSLTEQFDQIDADKNGQLSSEEIASAKPPEPMGPPPGLQLEASISADSTQAAGNADSILQQLLESLMKSFTDSYSKQDTGESADSATALAATADTDKVSGLSLDELASVDTSKDSGKAKLVNDLIKNFSDYDKDGDGQLSQSELQAAMPKEFSQQELAAMAGKNNSASDFGSALASFSSSFVEKLISSYKNGDLPNLASALNIAV